MTYWLSWKNRVDRTSSFKVIPDEKYAEIAVICANHQDAMDQLHMNYGLKHAGLQKENAKLKAELS